MSQWSGQSKILHKIIEQPFRFFKFRTESTCECWVQKEHLVYLSNKCNNKFSQSKPVARFRFWNEKLSAISLIDWCSTLMMFRWFKMRERDRKNEFYCCMKLNCEQWIDGWSVCSWILYCTYIVYIVCGYCTYTAAKLSNPPNTSEHSTALVTHLHCCLSTHA